MEATILLVSASAKAEGCASFLSKRLNASIEIVANRRSALATLRRSSHAAQSPHRSRQS
jgi:hypothetical protein